MHKCKKHILSTTLIIICFLQLAHTQLCNLPILSNFNNTTQSEFNAIWIDFNNNVEFYEIEFGIKSFTRTLDANITNITTPSFTFIDLQPGTTYEIYIRSVCDVNNKSEWNGPYFNNTNIDNNSGCELALSISDDNCPNRNTFNIEVTNFEDKILGTDVSLENIALTIAHTWPPDLDIQLTSPNGKTAILSMHNGNGVDNYGNPSGDCTLSANFNDKACISINDWIPPFLGNFNAEDELATTFDGEPANGIWKLSICDRAVGDVGLLNYINLEFSTETCQAPQEFVIFDIEGTNATFNWKSFGDCKTIKLTYKEIGAPPEEVFIDIIDCSSETFIATGLKQGTTYELNVNTECQGDLSSSPLCALTFETRCANSSSKETFDNAVNCEINCDSLCNLNGIWGLSNHNLKGGWYVQNGNTNNVLSGPKADKNGKGNYIQIDPSLNCFNNNTATITTECLDISGNNNCSISFYYHMFGIDIGTLILEYSTDENQWLILWEKKGDQGNEWRFESINLNNNVKKGKLRFRTESLTNTNQGIIALDHIKLYDSQITELNTFYQDLDNDGYGNRDSIFLLCSEIPIQGFSLNSLDCNDLNENINPSGIEIACNQIDENCNGSNDDTQSTDIEIIINEVNDESCKGSSDGSISIEASLGVSPFKFEWSNGYTEMDNINLTTGIYTCTVTGNDGCQTTTQPIFVGFEKILVYNVNNVSNSSCQGENDGSITINVAGGTEPYNITWENGDKGLTSQNLSAGFYKATITSNDGCELITDPIEILGNQILTTGVALKNDIDCSGDSTGFIQLGIIGGTEPYTINWSNGMTTAFISELKADSYSVTITDSRGCFSTITDIKIEEPDILEVVLNKKSNVICNGDFNGQVDINIRGGTPPYSYFWSNGTFAQDLFNIPKGNYSVTISDFKACSVTLSAIEIEEPEIFNITLDSISSVACSGSKEGFVSINVEGGTSPYVYNWSTSDGVNSVDASIASLLPGQYFVTIVDAFGCKSLPGKFEVNNQNIPINISLIQLDKIICNSDSSASIIALSESNNLPLDFNWSAGIKNIKNIISDTINSLIQGNYNITITDSEGCVGISDSILIDQPTAIQYEVTNLSNNDCYNEENGNITIEANGGTGDLSYTWTNDSNVANLSNLENGIYQVTINDEFSCEEVSEEINITSPDSITISALIVPSNENDNGSISISARGGIPPYIYNWDPIDIGIDSTVNNLPSGAYTLSLIDDNGCQIDTTFNVDFASSINHLEVTKLVEFFPNPVIGTLHINCLIPMCNLELNIIDLTGKVIKQIDLIDHQHIDLSNIEKGIYLLEFKSKKNYQLSKIIILR